MGDISMTDKTPFPIFKLREKWQRHNKFLQKISDADLLVRPRNCWHETAGTSQAAALSMLCTVTMHVIVTPTTLHVRTRSRCARRREDKTAIHLGPTSRCSVLLQRVSTVLSWRKSFLQLQSALFCTPRKYFPSHPQCSTDPDSPGYSADAQRRGCIPAGSSRWLTSFQSSTHSIRNLRTD